jgi:hypothetical protein
MILTLKCVFMWHTKIYFKMVIFEKRIKKIILKKINQIIIWKINSCLQCGSKKFNTVMDAHGRSEAHGRSDVHGRSWTFLEDRGRSRTIVDVLGRSWTFSDDRGRSRTIVDVNAVHDRLRRSRDGHDHASK